MHCLYWIINYGWVSVQTYLVLWCLFWNKKQNNKTKYNYRVKTMYSTHYKTNNTQSISSGSKPRCFPFLSDIYRGKISDNRCPKTWRDRCLIKKSEKKLRSFDKDLAKHTPINMWQVLVIPWFIRMYDAIMHERELVHCRTYMRRTMV